MNTLSLKLLALVLMLLDHIGFILGEPILRAFGRLALPLFAFLIANGFKHTRSVPKYALRLFLFALISEVPFDLLFLEGNIAFVGWHGILPDLHLDNIFFTLLIGLCYLWLNDLYRKRELKHAKLLSAATFIFLAAFATFASADYGVIGVAWVALFGLFDVSEKKNIVPLVAGSVLLAVWKHITTLLSSVVFKICGVNLAGIPVLNYFISGGFSIRQPLAALAIIPILLYNGKSGMPKSRKLSLVLQYAFYIFYPLHIMILYFISK